MVVVLIVLAVAKMLHTTATTRTVVLTARFIVFLLTCGFPGSGNLDCTNYIPAVKQELWNEKGDDFEGGWC